jgi:hypothetical protein
MPECGVEKASKKTAQGLPHGEALLMAPFSPTNSVACKPPSNPDLGSFVRAQIVAHQDDPN